MTDFTNLLRADRGETAIPVHLIDKAALPGWLAARPAATRTLVEAARFEGDAGAVLVVPVGDGFEVLAGVRDVAALGPWCLAGVAERVPAGVYRIVGDIAPGLAALGWMLAQHRFEAFKSKPKAAIGELVLLSRDAAGVADVVAQAVATALVRDLVDTPAGDLGPAELEAAVRGHLEGSGATIRVTQGDPLSQGYPMIHAVGRAAGPGRGPRLIEAEWGNPAHPRLAVIGKGVCFDSGGLDIKPAGGMRLMKKDMGGAAHALALAGLIVAARLPVRLHLLIPAVENAISGNAFRPGDVLASRAGITVEIDNTDAEGRLVLGDALTRAGEDAPRWIIDFATLTGAARVALGPDLPALFANDEALAAALIAGAERARDPVWRMPLWDNYSEMLNSDVADLANGASSPFAGAVIAALFLKRFAPEGVAWAHLDTFAWQPAAKPGRPKGGAALGLRAAYEAVRQLVAEE